MEEDAVNEEEVEYSFTLYEIDLDYEFDAARFFDFSRDESPTEARRAETWFHSAGSYPPSPFVARLVPRDDILMANVNVSPKSKGVETMSLCKSDSDFEADNEVPFTEMNYRGEGNNKGTSSSLDIGTQQILHNQSQKLPSGLAFYNHMMNATNSKNQPKLSKKSAFPRTSTFMKPTASQLAKQKRPFQSSHSRSCMHVLDKTSKSVASTCVIENQAAKRQKLDGGLLLKVMGTVQLQQTSFVHKASKTDGLLDRNRTHTKPKITIPIDPDLETAHRAHRTRDRDIRDKKETSAVRRFRALPLNRKILESPSLLPKRSTPRVPDFQEFHLKTLERSLQHSSASLKSAVPLNHSNKDFHKFTSNLSTDCGSRESGRPSLLNNNTTSGPEVYQSSQSFRALPLNKKILSSKGEIGVSRNSKKETTVPMEFNFQTGKRYDNNPPPVELFGKLSLACEMQPNPKVPWTLSTPAKGSKENRWGFFQQGNEVKQAAKMKLPVFGGLHQNRANEENFEELAHSVKVHKVEYVNDILMKTIK